MSKQIDIQRAIQEAVAQLNELQQLRLLEFIETFVGEGAKRNSDLLRFAGSIPLGDLQGMQASIENGCENLDQDGW